METAGTEVYVDLTSKRQRKIHVENSSIFRRFWKSNPDRNIHVESMSYFSRRFGFQNRCNFHELSTWNFDVESMANQWRCVHWIYTVYFVWRKFYQHMCFISMNSGLNTLSKYRYFYLSKNITSHTFLLVFRIVHSLQCILKDSF